MHSPTQGHFQAVKRILRYVKGTLDQGLHFSPGPCSLTAYADADWAGNPHDRRSTSGYCVYFGSNLISWSAKKQPTVARSSTEAEYRALANTAAELSWLSHLLKDLKVQCPVPYLVWCDNQSAISLASNPVFHARTKHIEIDYHFIREKVLNNQISVCYVPSERQVADIFTKSLPVARFDALKSKLMVFPLMSLQGDVKQEETRHLNSSTISNTISNNSDQNGNPSNSNSTSADKMSLRFQSM
jgi:hypothetical protein